MKLFIEFIFLSDPNGLKR